MPPRSQFILRATVSFVALLMLTSCAPRSPETRPTTAAAATGTPAPNHPGGSPTSAPTIANTAPSDVNRPPDLTFESEFTYAGTVPAPDFPAGLEWLNVSRPLSLVQDLRGKIVLLDFWTLGCINCIHIIPDLERLESEFPDSLVVIGVHSAKFSTEGELESIRQAVLRYGLEHPVVNDSGFQVWNSYSARAWPTIYIIDPLGNVVGYHAGEGIHSLLFQLLSTMEAEFKAAGLIDERPLETVLESKATVPTILNFPGKLLADEASDRLYIADSNHNRIVMTTLSGEILDVIGSGETAFADGTFETAALHRPQGMALSDDGSTLYIADLENHALRAADLETRTVTTLAGTGRQAQVYPNGSPGKQTSLSSPWDVYASGDFIYIATAGLHQIWRYDLVNDRVEVFAGSGAEGIDDGSLPAASLAQPSGFASDGASLFFTDPESSSVRRVDLDPSGILETIIGTGLFDWGDVDGAYPEAMLQHPLGIVFHEGLLYIADTYNHKIKTVDPIAQTVRTWAGDGAIGWLDGPPGTARFAEPSGLSIAGNRLYIADTNNHLVRVADLESGVVETLVLSNITRALPPAVAMGLPLTASIGTQTVGPGTGVLDIVIDLPEGYKFNDLGPFTLTWSAADPAIAAIAAGAEPRYQQTGPSFPLSFPIELSAGETMLHISATVFFCESVDENVCLVQDVALEVPIIVSDGSVGSDLLIAYQLPEPDL